MLCGCEREHLVSVRLRIAVETNGRKYVPIPGKIPGTELNLGGNIFVAAPFNLDGVQEAMTLLETLKDAKTASESLRGAAAVLLISLQRNYPDLTLDELVPLIDMGNWERALLAVCGSSGIHFTAGEPAPASP
jgi:hypothetical protein